MFIMPSKYEPCGLNQMYSLTYGTVPIVRDTGGLSDTVTDYTKPNGNGFLFEKYDSNELLKAIREAIEAFKDKNKWYKIMRNGMALDFSGKYRQKNI